MVETYVHLEKNLERELPKSKETKLKISGKSIASALHPEMNEDTIAYSWGKKYAMVFDGIGGSQGEKASRTAGRFLAEKLGQVKENNPDTVKNILRTLFDEASKMVARVVPGGGTTATVTKFIEHNGQKKAIIAHVGDSRAYLLRDHQLHQITEDDVQRNVLTQSLGQTEHLKPSIYEVSLQDTDKILLTSNGIHDNLTKSEIEKIVQLSPHDSTEELIEEAKNRSQDPNHIRAKPDDMSAVVIEVYAASHLEDKDNPVTILLSRYREHQKNNPTVEVLAEEITRRDRGRSHFLNRLSFLKGLVNPTKDFLKGFVIGAGVKSAVRYGLLASGAVNPFFVYGAAAAASGGWSLWREYNKQKKEAALNGVTHPKWDRINLMNAFCTGAAMGTVGVIAGDLLAEQGVDFIQSNLKLALPNLSLPHISFPSLNLDWLRLPALPSLSLNSSPTLENTETAVPFPTFVETSPEDSIVPPSPSTENPEITPPSLSPIDPLDSEPPQVVDIPQSPLLPESESPPIVATSTNIDQISSSVDFSKIPLSADLEAGQTTWGELEKELKKATGDKFTAAEFTEKLKLATKEACKLSGIASPELGIDGPMFKDERLLPIGYKIFVREAIQKALAA